MKAPAKEVGSMSCINNSANDSDGNTGDNGNLSHALETGLCLNADPASRAVHRTSPPPTMVARLHAMSEQNHTSQVPHFLPQPGTPLLSPGLSMYTFPNQSPYRSPSASFQVEETDASAQKPHKGSASNPYDVVIGGDLCPVYLGLIFVFRIDPYPVGPNTQCAAYAIMTLEGVIDNNFFLYVIDARNLILKIRTLTWLEKKYAELCAAMAGPHDLACEQTKTAMESAMRMVENDSDLQHTYFKLAFSENLDKNILSTGTEVIMNGKLVVEPEHTNSYHWAIGVEGSLIDSKEQGCANGAD